MLLHEAGSISTTYLTSMEIYTQLTFTNSKSTMETTVKCVISVQS